MTLFRSKIKFEWLGLIAAKPGASTGCGNEILPHIVEEHIRNILAISIFAASSLLLAGPVHAEKVFQARTSAATPLSATVDELTTVLQIAIPAGRRVIQAKTQAGNFGTLETVRCQLFKGTTSLDGSGTNVGSTDGLLFVAMLVNQAVTRTVSTTIISFKCNHTEGTQSGLYLDSGSSLIIEEVVP